VSKPHREGGVLVVNIANPTAGFLAGDRARCDVRVESGAALLLTTPAANRAFRMRAGSAEVEQRFAVARGGWLEFWPEIFIPQAGAHYRQSTVIRAEAGAELLFFEALAPGRVASGEVFAYGSLQWETDVWVGEALAARERYRLVPEGEAVRALRRAFPEAYYASCLVVTDRLPASHPCWREIHGWQGEDLWIGAGALAYGGHAIKLLASGSVRLRAALAALRALLHGALGRPVPSIRRV
jgi:urease accessory protein